MTGIANVSAGKAFNWYGEGKAEFKAGSNLDVSYGVKTEVSIALKSDISIAGQTGVSIGSKFEYAAGIKMAIHESDNLEVKEDGNFNAMDTYVGTVGHNADKLVAAKILKTAIKTLLQAQTTLMVAAAGYTAYSKIKDPGSEEALRDPILDMKLGHLMSIATMAATLTPALLVFYQKWTAVANANQAICTLSMDNVGVTYLGTRQLAPTYATSGLFLDGTKAQLSSSTRDLRPVKADNGKTTLRYDRQAGDMGHGGSRLDMLATGEARLYAKSFTAKINHPTDTTRYDVYAQKIGLWATTTSASNDSNPLMPTQTHVMVNDDSISLSQKSGAKTLLLSDDGISASAGTTQAQLAMGSVMSVTPSAAMLGHQGNNVTINAQSACMTFGNSSIRLDPTGVTIGGNLTILNPGAPALTFPALQQAIQDIAQLTAQTATIAATQTADGARITAVETAQQTLNTTLAKTRNRVKTVAAAAFNPRR